jgi:hypothetical protein
MKWLTTLAKYVGCYDRWQELRKRCSLKCTAGNESLQSLQRFFNPLNLDVMLQRIKEMVRIFLLFLIRERRITQCSCLENDFPFTIWHLCKNFANTSFPRKILASHLLPPMCVNIDYSKCCVAFFTDFNFNRFAIIANQVIVVKDILPVLAPTFTVEMR